MEQLNPDERWAPIPGFPGYEASDQGRIRSIDRTVTSRTGVTRRIKGRVLAPSTQYANQGTYPLVKVELWEDGKGSSHTVHKLVLWAFVGPSPEGMECCHNNGNPADNRLTNLRWDTKSSNRMDMQLHGTDPKRNRARCPYGHSLVAPNLAAWKLRKGIRECLACSRARVCVFKAKRAGVVIDMQAESDRRYSMIMLRRT